MNKYKFDKQFKTYICKANDIYKIGKARDPKKRLKQLQTGNPDIELVKEFDGDIEQELHKAFEEVHYKNEWFKLTEEDINSIIVIDDIIEIKDYFKKSKVMPNHLLKYYRSLSLDERIKLAKSLPSEPMPKNIFRIIKTSKGSIRCIYQ